MLRPLLLLLLLPVVATATALPEKLQADFAPLDGVIVLATPGQILIDRDGGSGVVVGDLFAIVTPGAPILHPTSGAILGTSHSVSGWLRVAGVRSGYSEATLQAESAPAAVGAKVSRFAEAEAVLIDLSGSAADLYPQLSAVLPQLRWLGYFTSTAALPAPTLTPRLLFTVAGNALEVREERSGLLRRYPLAIPAPVAAPVMTPPPASSSYWNGPAQKGVARGLEIADLDGDGRNETITATLHGLEIGRFSGKEYQTLAEINLGLSHNLLSVDAYDSDRDGKMELWVTAHRDADLDSMVLLWDGKSTITRGAEHLGWWLRALTLPGAGRTLLAQQMGGDDFSGAIMHIALHNGKISTSPAALPGNLSLYGLARLGTAENPLTVQLNAYDNLVIRGGITKFSKKGRRSTAAAKPLSPASIPSAVATIRISAISTRRRASKSWGATLSLPRRILAPVLSSGSGSSNNPVLIFYSGTARRFGRSSPDASRTAIWSTIAMPISTMTAQKSSLPSSSPPAPASAARDVT